MSQPLPHYAAKQVRESGGQYYVDGSGDRLPSVSTVLNSTRPPERREALANWRQRLGTDAANQITRTATQRGTGTHKQIQRYLQGQPVQCSEAVQPYWQSVEPVLQDIDDIRLVEGTVFHHDARYAGKVDCVASYRGTPCVCEWKTADRPKGELAHLYDYPLQLVAYWGAVNYCYQDYDVELRHALLVVAIPDQAAEVFWLELSEILMYWQHWQERLALFWRRKGQFWRL